MMPRSRYNFSIASLAVRSVAILVPICLFLAHMNRGADFPDTGTTFSFGFLALFAIAIIASGLRSTPPFMAAFAVLFGAWWAGGFFGAGTVARHELLTLAAAGAVTGLGFFVGSHDRALKTAWSALIWSLLVFVILSLFDYATADFSERTRLTGPFGSANTAATLMAMSVLIATSKITARLQHPNMSRLTRSDRVTYLAQSEYASIGLATLASVGLLLTVSRAGILLGLICVIALSAIEINRVVKRGQLSLLKRRRVLIPVALGVLTVIFLALTGDINPQSTEDILHNMGGRVYLLEHYHGVWLERPWFGHGLGSFNLLNDQTTTLENAASLSSMGAAHNVVLQWLVQQGVVGLTIMLLILLILLGTIVRALASPSRIPRHFLRLSLILTVLVFGHGMVDYALEIPSVMWTYAFVLGIATGLSTRTRPSQNEPAQ